MRVKGEVFIPLNGGAIYKDGMILLNEVGQVLGEVFAGLRDEVAEAAQSFEADGVLGSDFGVLHGLAQPRVEVLAIAAQLEKKGEMVDPGGAVAQLLPG